MRGSTAIVRFRGRDLAGVDSSVRLGSPRRVELANGVTGATWKAGACVAVGVEVAGGPHVAVRLLCFLVVTMIVVESPRTWVVTTSDDEKENDPGRSLSQTVSGVLAILRCSVEVSALHGFFDLRARVALTEKIDVRPPPFY